MTITELKMEAKQRMASKLGTISGATLIYMGICLVALFAILYVYSASLLAKGVFDSIESMQAYIMQTSESYTYSFIIDAVSVVVRAIFAVFLAGIQYMCIANLRGKEIKVSDILYSVKNNPDKIIIIVVLKALLSFLFSLPVNVMAIMSDKINGGALFGLLYSVFNIISIAADIAVMVLMSQCVFLYIDNPQGKVISYIEESMTLMRRYAGKYILLLLSFIPIQILSIISLGIMFIWVIPYQHTTYALFYMKIKGEQENTIDVTVQ